MEEQMSIVTHPRRGTHSLRAAPRDLMGQCGYLSLYLPLVPCLGFDLVLVEAHALMEMEHLLQPLVLPLQSLIFDYLLSSCGLLI